MSLVTAGGIETARVPGWAELPWLVHGFSMRAGGETTVYRTDRARESSSSGRNGEFRSERDGDLNLGFTAEDSREVVTLNRELLLAHLLGSRQTIEEQASQMASGLVTVRQTHSAATHRVDRSHVLGFGSAAVLEGDGLMTDTPGVLLGILTADCVPVLVVDPVRRAVAAFHAGWRGTLQQIVEQGVGRMQQEFGSVPKDLQATVGPAIGGCCYTVGEEVRAQFVERFEYARELFVEVDRPLPGTAIGAKPGGTDTSLRLDLAEANRRQLLHAGLSDVNIAMTGACTSCETANFFSHRAEQGVTGRMMAVIGMRAS